MTDQTPNLSLPYILASQAQKHVTHNEAIRALDALVQLAVVDDTHTSPPAAPVDGDRYIVPAGASGDWTSHQGAIAAFQDGAWAFYRPMPGWTAWVASAGAARTFSGTAWVSAGGSGSASVNPTPLVGINTTADATNRLSLSAAASLFNHEGHGHQQKINKATAADTASMLFQTAFSGRAEVGLSGDDNLHFKVSPDGSVWKEGFVIERNTGAPRFPLFPSASLPSASTAGAGAVIFVPDGTTGPGLYVSDGTAWIASGGSGSTPQAATPTFIPAAGTYTSAQSIAITSPTAGAAVHYTTDASTPTAASPTYTSPIPLTSNGTTTIKAVASKSGYSDSAVATAAYVISISQVATPTFSPAAGSYSAAQSVALACATSGAAIYFTTDGTAPTTASTPYTAPVFVAANTTLRAIAVKTGFTNSSIGTAAFTITLTPAPLFVFIGESNPTGLAPNASATTLELGSRSQVQLWNNLTSAFENLNISSGDNLLGADNFAGLGTHSWELELANAFVAGRFSQSQGYLVKAAQGGSQIAQWLTTSPFKSTAPGTVAFTNGGAGSTMWGYASARIAAAITAMQAAGKTPIPYVFASIGINDEVGSTVYSLAATTSWATFQSNYQDLISRLRGLLGATTPVLMTTFNGPVQICTDVNTAVAAIAAADSHALAISSLNASVISDNHHWDYLGMKLMAERLIDGALSFNGTATAPAIAPAAGSYAGAQTVTLTPATGALQTRYTTDGSDPLGAAASIYGAPFSVTPPATVSARTIAVDKASALASSIYALSASSTWNTTDAAGTFVLTNANRIAARVSGASAWKSVRGTVGVSTGLKYAELKLTTADVGGGSMLGIANAAFSVASHLGTGGGGFGAGNYRCGGYFTASGNDVSALQAAIGAPNLNDVVMLAVDETTGKLWFGLNGSWIGGANPAAGTGAHVTWTPSAVGAVYPAISLIGTAGYSDGAYQLQTSTGQLSYTPPSGFTAWDS